MSAPCPPQIDTTPLPPSQARLQESTRGLFHVTTPGDHHARAGIPATQLPRGAAQSLWGEAFPRETQSWGFPPMSPALVSLMFPQPTAGAELPDLALWAMGTQLFCYPLEMRVAPWGMWRRWVGIQQCHYLLWEYREANLLPGLLLCCQDSNHPSKCPK